MGRVKTDGEAKGLHDGDGAHVADEVVIAEGGAAVGEDDPLVARSDEFFNDVFHVPGGEELPFLDVDGGRSLGGSEEEVGLAAEKGGNLDDVAERAGAYGLFGSVDVGEDGETEFGADALENGEAEFKARSAKGVDRGSVRFVVGALEDELKGKGAEDLFELLGSFESKVFRFDDARAAKNSERLMIPDKKRANGDVFHCVRS